MWHPSGDSAHEHHVHKNKPSHEPHQHAFVMLGEAALFVCHITQYAWEEHRYQFIVEAQLPDAAAAAYRDERRRNPKDSYFIVNSPRDLVTLPSLQARDRDTLLCNIYRGIPANPPPGLPWNNAKPVIGDVVLSIKRTVHFRPFSDQMQYPERLTYLLFGSAGEAHMTNWQTKEPDFDHVLSLTAPPHWLAQDLLRAGVIVDFQDLPSPREGQWPPLLRTNPLKEGAELPVRYRGEKHWGKVRIGPTFWFCTNVANKEDPRGGMGGPCGSLTPIE